MEELVRFLKTNGGPWRRVLKDPRFSSLESKFLWFTDPRSGMFYRLVSPGRKGSFLEVGAASGIVSACLSEEYERGYALEEQAVFVEFMKHRFQMDSIKNVQVMHGNALDIPLLDTSVDLVAVNGVMERMPTGVLGENPRKVQMRFLREARRCLSSGGKIVIAIENAWHHRLLMGNAVNRAVEKRHGTESIYSYFGYKKLLAEAGFSNVRIFVVMPDYCLPVDIYSFNRRSLTELYLKYHSGSRLGRMLKRLSNVLGAPYLGAYFTKAFYVEAEK
jgi:SAM-dependent methyltransferase